MTAQQIVDIIEQRLNELSNEADYALDMMMDKHTKQDMFEVYENRYNNAYERIYELRRLLRKIATVASDADLYRKSCHCLSIDEV